MSPQALIAIGKNLIQNNVFTPVLSIGRLAKQRIDTLSNQFVANCQQEARLAVLSAEKERLKAIKKELQPELKQERKELKAAKLRTPARACYDASKYDEYEKQILALAQIMIEAAYKARQQQLVDHVGSTIAWCSSNVRNPNHVLELANNIAKRYDASTIGGVADNDWR
jgi:outer membrane murein-binding lipoprotein Lpp